MSKKKIGIIVAVVIIIAAAGGGAWYFLNGNLGVGNSADKVYVEKVSTLEEPCVFHPAGRLPLSSSLRQRGRSFARRVPLLCCPVLSTLRDA